jgi:DNA-binding transcriptional ArsR family regulator
LDTTIAIANKLKVMGHPVRLQILNMLRQGETCVCHIEQALGRRQAYVSQQLMVLRDAGMVDSRREGLQVYYRLIDPQAADVLSVLMNPPDADGLVWLDGCPCPSCATERIPEIG